MKGLVRRAVRADCSALAAIETACFSVPWSVKSLQDMFDNPCGRLYCVDFCEHSALQESSCVLPCYGGAYFMGEDGDITNIATLPEYRRQGMAEAVLDAVIASALQEGVHFLHLEVRISNAPAIALYEKKGFSRDGVRRNYYRKPTEDALLMTLTL